jgi:hypothetical protein
MTPLDLIAAKGLAKAEELILHSLIEKIAIPKFEEITENFIYCLIDDLGDFLTLEQYLDTKELYSKAATYCYGKGAEFALSHRIKKPIERIGYNFDHCMQSEISAAIPPPLLNQITIHTNAILDIYFNMYQMVSQNQEQLICTGIPFDKCLLRIFSVLFFIGKKVSLSLKMDEDIVIDFTASTIDVKYNYDTYDGKYTESNI